MQTSSAWLILSDADDSRPKLVLKPLLVLRPLWLSHEAWVFLMQAFLRYSFMSFILSSLIESESLVHLFSD